jgi:hypothetical protein
VEVDPRWGIAEEQATRKETLKFCLDEIHACRPFFIGLLGERYGWTTGADAFTADLREEQLWIRGLTGIGVTELEILHGVLNDPEMARGDESYALGSVRFLYSGQGTSNSIGLIARQRGRAPRAFICSFSPMVSQAVRRRKA